MLLKGISANMRTRLAQKRAVTQGGIATGLFNHPRLCVVKPTPAMFPRRTPDLAVLRSAPVSSSRDKTQKAYEISRQQMA
ncbi:MULTISPECIES: hypothetical protein [unclassified Desulfovibrio]|uniref:hypothetical protein n=1 Tax=unclassified Desulfovibrio TaxID=2593640 RepID=UPI002FDB2C9E